MVDQLDIQAIAEFVLETADFSELYEDDAFVVELLGQRTYVERQRHCFVLHVDAQRVRVPRH